MSKLLEDFKSQLTRARNLAYYGKYSESIAGFNDIIDKTTAQIAAFTDKSIIEVWNKLLNDLKIQRDLASNLKQELQGNFDSQQPKRERQIPEELSVRQLGKMKKNPSFYEATNDQVHALPNKFKKQLALHQDDQLYNQKERELKNKERDMQKEAEKEREREYEEREAEIWPKKKPVLKKAASKNNGPPPSASNNNSGVVKGGANNREYPKPWKENVKKPGKETKGEGEVEEKKSFLKHCYPDGNGPDSNLIQMLEKQVVCFNPNVSFDDIAELQKAKDVLEEAVLLPLKLPHLFTGIRRAWKGVLLFGPPGTGKTLLAKAIASSGNTTFFNVTSSSLASKWKGQSQKLVRLLFEMAYFYAPATIFIDQIDSLASKRGEKEDESSRKVKTELMTRIDGVSSGQEGKSIVLIGATNRPWDLDEAIRRRLQKRIYIPLPTQIGRREMLRINLRTLQTDGVDIQEVVRRTDGYSGADISLLCREAAYIPMRRKLKSVRGGEKEGGLRKRLDDMQWRKEFEKEVTVPLTMQDFQEALKNVKPSVGKGDLANYDTWMAQFGEQGTN